VQSSELRGLIGDLHVAEQAVDLDLDLGTVAGSGLGRPPRRLNPPTRTRLPAGTRSTRSPATPTKVACAGSTAYLGPGGAGVADAIAGLGWNDVDPLTWDGGPLATGLLLLGLVGGLLRSLRIWGSAAGAGRDRTRSISALGAVIS
jgi:hypothetical protein